MLCVRVCARVFVSMLVRTFERVFVHTHELQYARAQHVANTQQIIFPSPSKASAIQPASVSSEKQGRRNGAIDSCKQVTSLLDTRVFTKHSIHSVHGNKNLHQSNTKISKVYQIKQRFCSVPDSTRTATASSVRARAVRALVTNNQESR